VIFRPSEHKTPGISRAPWDEEGTLAEPWSVLLDFPQGHKTLRELRNEVQVPSERMRGSCEHRGVRVTFNGALRNSDNAAFVDVMGEYMCVVDIRVDSPTYQVRI